MFIRQLWVMLKQKNWKGKFIWKYFSIKPTYRGSLLSSSYCFGISELYPFHFCLDLIHRESCTLPRVIIYLNVRYSSILHMGCRILKENQIQPHRVHELLPEDKSHFNFFFFLIYFWLHLQHMGSQFPDQGPLHTQPYPSRRFWRKESGKLILSL